MHTQQQTPEGKSALNEYIEQHEKVVKAYKIYRESVVAEVEVPKVEKSANELRAEIIEKAKEFVEITKTKEFTGRVRTGAGLPGEGQTKIYCDVYVFGDKPKNVCDVEFIVHQEKRTVVTLMRGTVTKKVYSKGIAKCNPDDVFNEHIGKAIALGRALGKDVSEFENAVQPTEPVVGHKLSNELEEGIDEVTAVKGFRMLVNDDNEFWNKDTLARGVTKITNDTNAQYGGVE